MLIRIIIELIDIKIVRGMKFEIKITTERFISVGYGILGLGLLFIRVIMCIRVLFACCLLILIANHYFMTIAML